MSRKYLNMIIIALIPIECYLVAGAGVAVVVDHADVVNMKRRREK